MKSFAVTVSVVAAEVRTVNEVSSSPLIEEFLSGRLGDDHGVGVAEGEGNLTKRNANRAVVDDQGHLNSTLNTVDNAVQNGGRSVFSGFLLRGRGVIDMVSKESHLLALR